MAFASTPLPIESIWGSVVTAEQILPGIWQVTTSEHGGLLLSEDRQSAMPAMLRVNGSQYEEDIDWTLVILAYEEEFAHCGLSGARVMIQQAHGIARNWRPEAYSALTGRAIEARESYILGQREAYRALIGEIVVTAAFGDWADWVPTGKVGLIGRRLCAVDYLGRLTYGGPNIRALAAANRYDSASSPNSFAAIEAEPLP